MYISPGVYACFVAWSDGLFSPECMCACAHKELDRCVWIFYFTFCPFLNKSLLPPCVCVHVHVTVLHVWMSLLPALRWDSSQIILSSFVRAEIGKAVPFERATEVISVFKWAFSCVSFCTISNCFVTASFSYYCLLKWLWHFHMQYGAICPLDFTFYQTADCPGAMRIPSASSCWYFGLPAYSIQKIVMDFNGNGVHVSIILMVDTHGRIHPRGVKYLHLMKSNMWESSGSISPHGATTWVVG